MSRSRRVSAQAARLGFVLAMCVLVAPAADAASSITGKWANYARTGSGLCIDIRPFDGWDRPFALDLKVKNGKLSGTVKELKCGATGDIEEGKVSGNRFEFTAIVKVHGAKISTIFKGTVTGGALYVTRYSSPDQPISRSGVPEILIFNRTK